VCLSNYTRQAVKDLAPRTWVLPNAVDKSFFDLQAAPDESAPPAGLWDRRISYSTGKKSVQYIVIDLAKQVGLGYDWNKSFAQTDPDCTRFVFGLSIDNQPFEKAMARVLKPVNLRYQVENGQVVLYPR